MSLTIKNVIKIIDGNRKQLCDYILKDGISFNKITPMPEELNVEENYKNTMNLRKYLNEHLELKGYEKWRGPDEGGDLEIGKVLAENIAKYGHPTWYGWRMEHWGTKWEAVNIYKEKDMVIFETPDTTPEPIIQKLSKMFPQTTFEWYWASEDGEKTGCYKVKNGQFQELEIKNIYKTLWR